MASLSAAKTPKLLLLWNKHGEARTLHCQFSRLNPYCFCTLRDSSQVRETVGTSFSPRFRSTHEISEPSNRCPSHLAVIVRYLSWPWPTMQASSCGGHRGQSDHRPLTRNPPARQGSLRHRGCLGAQLRHFGGAPKCRVRFCLLNLHLDAAAAFSAP